MSDAIELDLGSLSAFDPSAAATRDEAVCKAQATALTQALFNALLALPGDNGPTGRSVTLPAPTSLLPRAKPLPKPRLPTKWEQFAQKKGIQKRKRSSLAFDEKEQTWKRRYGYNRANAGDVGEPVLEAKSSDKVPYHPHCVVLRSLGQARVVYRRQRRHILISMHAFKLQLGRSKDDLVYTMV